MDGDISLSVSLKFSALSRFNWNPAVLHSARLKENDA